MFKKMMWSLSEEEMAEYNKYDEKAKKTIKYLKEWNEMSAKRNYDEWYEKLMTENEAHRIKENEISIAKELLKDGKMSVKKIIKITNLSKKELNKIKSEL